MDQIDSIAPQVKADERLMLLFWALSEPLTISQMAARGFLGKPGLQPDSYERTFRRIREDLRDNGIYLEEVARAGEVAWRVDKTATYMQTGPLSQDAVLDIVVILQAYLASHADGPQHADRAWLDLLRRAHDKLAVESGRTCALMGLSCTDPSQVKGWASLLDAYVDRRGVRFAYRDAHGTASVRDVDVYGVFQHADHLFFVSWDRDRTAMRVFRDDRVDASSVQVCARSFEVPDGFDVQAYMGLPFEYGTDEGQATFTCEGDPSQARRYTGKRGVWDGASWHVEMRDAGSAARWAVGAMQQADLVPLGPQGLVDELVQGLRKVEAQHGQGI